MRKNMATLTIRNLDKGIVESLKLHAKGNNRSLEAEARTLLERHARMPSARALIALAEDIAAMTPRDRTQSDSAALLREEHR
jgi:plasmid stability protein